jgi:hypothetical protein
MPRVFDDVGECVEDTLARVGPRIVLALPLGIGKPNPLVNEFYRRARRDAALSLTIFTALSLRAPRWKGELERRFLEPLVVRLFGADVPLDYLTDLHGAGVPDNVQIIEFFLEPGALLGVAHSQRHYVSSNYTHVARDVAARGVNVIAQLIAKRSVEGRSEYSLGSNPDVTLDLLAHLAPQRQAGREIVVIGEVNRQMPFMFGPAAVATETFDALVEHPRYEYDLFAPPNQGLGAADHAIGLYCASLVRDGGTLQIGIGALGDAVVYGLQLRHRQNGEFREILQNFRAGERFGQILDAVGDAAPFEAGLYGCSEMFVDGFLDLYRSGVLRRRVYADERIQRLLNDGKVGERIDERFLAALAGEGFSDPLSAAEFERLRELGVFRRECRFQAGRIENAEGQSAAASLGTANARRGLLACCTGRRLIAGILLHGTFFLGPRGFYAALRELPEDERRQFSMCGVHHDDDAARGRGIGRPGRRTCRQRSWRSIQFCGNGACIARCAFHPHASQHTPQGFQARLEYRLELRQHDHPASPARHRGDRIRRRRFARLERSGCNRSAAEHCRLALSRRTQARSPGCRKAAPRLSDSRIASEQHAVRSRGALYSRARPRTVLGIPVRHGFDRRGNRAGEGAGQLEGKDRARLATHQGPGGCGGIARHPG